jgi:hypothetical protein
VVRHASESDTKGNTAVASLDPITATRAATPPGTAGSADLVLRNGRIFTGDPARPAAAALAVSAGRITAVGDEADIAALAGPATRVVDALGRRVIPGLNDSHIHLILKRARTYMEQCVDRLEAFIDEAGLDRAKIRPEKRHAISLGADVYENSPVLAAAKIPGPGAASGCSPARLNGKVLADLLTGDDDGEITRLCLFVNRRVIRWPAEPAATAAKYAIRGYLQAENAFHERAPRTQGTKLAPAPTSFLPRSCYLRHRTTNSQPATSGMPPATCAGGCLSAPGGCG